MGKGPDLAAKFAIVPDSSATNTEGPAGPCPRKNSTLGTTFMTLRRLSVPYLTAIPGAPLNLSSGQQDILYSIFPFLVSNCSFIFNFLYFFIFNTHLHDLNDLLFTFVHDIFIQPIIAACRSCLSNLPHTVELAIGSSRYCRSFHSATISLIAHDVCDLFTYPPNKIPKNQLIYKVRVKIHANEW